MIGTAEEIDTAKSLFERLERFKNNKISLEMIKGLGIKGWQRCDGLSGYRKRYRNSSAQMAFGWTYRFEKYALYCKMRGYIFGWSVKRNHWRAGIWKNSQSRGE